MAIKEGRSDTMPILTDSESNFVSPRPMILERVYEENPSPHM